jgi:DNA-binding XRE family transcriptional regulator
MTTNALRKNSYSGDMSARKAMPAPSRRKPSTAKAARPAAGKAARYPNRVNELAKERNLTHDDIAAALGVNRVTIADRARGAVPMKQDWAQRFADLFGVPVADIFEKPLTSGMRTVPIILELQAGNWADQSFLPDNFGNIVIPDDPAYRSMSLYAGRIVGESMNKIYPNGSIVILSRKQDRPGEIVAGKRYHIRRTRGGQLIEQTIKTLVKDAKGQYWMQPESDSPEFAAVPLESAPEETIEIIGRVRYAVRRED